MEEVTQQHSSQTILSNHKFNLWLIGGISLVILFSGTVGYLLSNQPKQIKRAIGKASSHTQKSNTSPTPTPTPILFNPSANTSQQQSNIPNGTPPPPSSGLATTSGWLPTPLKSRQDLPIIASVVIAWVIQHRSSSNPEISFTANDGTYAQGLLGDLTQAGGEGWFAAKINGTWTVVYVGQAIPKCSDIAQYHLPKDWLSCDSSL